MSTAERRRTLASLVEEDAPVAPRRAAAVLVAVARELRRVEELGTEPLGLRSDQVLLGDDGSVQLAPPDAPDAGGVGAGAALGRLLFELLVGRAPLSAQDAFEPHVRRSIGDAGVALLSRSCSESPGQWPSVAEWQPTLAGIAGAQAPPEPLRHAAARRRRRTLLVVALVVLAAISVAVVLLAPGWWDDATTEHGLGAAQAVARS